MARFMSLIDGQLRGQEEAGALPAVYDEVLTVVTGTPGAGEIQTNGTDSDGNDILTTGTAITLPNSETFEGDELRVDLNGQLMDDVADYNPEGAGPPFSQISFTFDLYPDDKIRFFKSRDA